METRILQFAKALRAGGIPVSQAETLDAMQAMLSIGISEKQQFRRSLRATLIKNAPDLELFDELFPIFFEGVDGAPPDMQNIMEGMSDEEAQALAQALRQLKADLAEALKRLLRGDKLTPEQLQRLASMTGLNRTRHFRYKDWMVQRMLKALQHDAVRDAMREISQLLSQLGFSKARLQELREMLQENMDAESDFLEQFAGQRITENMEAKPPAPEVDEVMDQPFGYLNEEEMDVLRQEVRRLSAKLRTRISLRQKREKSGQLDLKATLRQNLRYGAVPFKLSYRRKQKRPKLVVICDISTSMRYCSELMLSLVFAMQDQISKTNAFAFNDHLEFITPDFESRSSKEAVEKVLIRMPPGHYSTDLGGSLREFQRDYFDQIDHRTTLLMVGDARNNYRDPGLDIFKTMAQRSRHTIWLNPEPPMLWGSGDSDMQVYLPFCRHVFQVQTMAELAAAVDEWLTA